MLKRAGVDLERAAVPHVQPRLGWFLRLGVTEPVELLMKIIRADRKSLLQRKIVGIDTGGQRQPPQLKVPNGSAIHVKQHPGEENDQDQDGDGNDPEDGAAL